jgi:hypothetical protein
MSDKQSIGEILAQALSEIEDIGGRDRHQLSQLIGRDTYDRLVASAKGSALLDRWEAASAKTKPAAVKALSVAVAKVANKPELLKRIESEIHDSFDEPPEAGSSAESSKRTTTPDRTKKPAAARNGHGHKPDLSKLAKSDDVEAYARARRAQT